MADYSLKKVSIISGIYNVANFLEKKKLHCIKNQSYKNWELILIDDGSTDDSGKICDEFAKEDHRIRVAHQKNSGLGVVRNVGLDISTGDYIWFYDVDDEVNPNLLEYCVSMMERYNTDMMLFGFKAITMYPYHSEENVYMTEKLIENNDTLRDCFLDSILFTKYGSGFCPMKFYRRSFIEKYNLRFEDLRIQQDEVFNLKIYPLAQRVYLSPEVLYNYYIYEKGNTRSRFIPNRFDIYVSIRDEFERLRGVWSIADSRFDNYLQKRFYQSVDQTLRFNLQHLDCPWNEEEKKNEMDRVMNHPYTIESMTWALKNIRGLENMLYFYAYRHRSLALLSISSSIFTSLRNLKHKLS